jgi:hypothetical protein
MLISSIRMKALGLIPLMVLGLVMGGCAFSTPAARSDAPPIHTRCLNDRSEGSTRPIIFLFCAESP